MNLGSGTRAARAGSRRCAYVLRRVALLVGGLALGAGLSVVSVTLGGATAHQPPSSGPAMVYRAPAGGPHHRDLILRRDGACVVLVDARTGRVLSSQRTAALSGIAIEGANGAVDNTLTVDLSGGPIDATRGISWDGGVGGYNTLDVRGGGVARATNLVLGPHSGVYTVGSTRIAYSHIAPVVDTVPSATFTETVPSGTTSITVASGPIESGDDTLTITCLEGSSPCGESITVANKSQVVVQADPSDSTAETWAFNAATASTGLTAVAFSGGAGANSLAVDAYPSGVPLTTTKIPTITPGSTSFSATEGGSVSTTVGTFTDTNPTADASAYTATVNWGDGSSPTSGTVTSGGVTEPGGTGPPTSPHSALPGRTPTPKRAVTPPASTSRAPMGVRRR